MQELNIMNYDYSYVSIATHESLHTIVVPCHNTDELVMINASTDAPIVTYTVLVLLYISE